MPSPSSEPAGVGGPRGDILLWLVAVGFFMQTLDATIVNTALPAMAESLGESPLRMQWVVVAYSLTMAMLIPASGWISDRFGTRRVYLGAILLFGLGSLACALSPSLPALIAARVLQGLGGALLLPVGRLAVLRAYPREQFLRAMSFVSVPGLIGPLLGPTLGGWLVEYASWHWIFLINLPVAVIGCVATVLHMPSGLGYAVKRFDLGGYALLAFGMVAVSLSLDGLTGIGQEQANVLVLLVFGFVSITAYWLRAARRPDPLFAPGLFLVPSLRIGLLGNLFARIGSGCMPFLIPLLLQVCMGYAPAQAGMMMLPVALAGMGAKPLVTRLILRFGYRRVLVGNTLCVGFMMMTFAWAGPDQPLWLHLLRLACFGAVNSMQFTAMNTLTLKDLESDSASSGNSLLSMVQMLAIGMGVAAAATVLTGYTAHFTGHGVAQTLRAFHATFLTMGVVTMASAWIFWQLPQAGLADRASPARSEPNEGA
ncbi:multidrug transporter subunit MdtD [Ramlibacter sp. H39-3-26]|uniref:multidrug transporter subunit MdtD n=1 Tax=Curvibacter soli TaxID=3031331 RepID=UPI0023DBDB48|nr:multidrug transporter subunit MdtD [Ramlibacter sp. H39-3-26]MDF1486459.1 multidrug transporter subunit MdtD [Ramlibacter sp. H39-3-26]